MARQTVTGWLFDLYPSARGITLWIAAKDGSRHRCHAPFEPAFHLRLTAAEAARLPALAARVQGGVTLERTARRDIYSDEEWDVVRVGVRDVRQLRRAVQVLERHFPYNAFFDSDIPAPQLFLYHTGLFPLAFGDYELEGDTLAGWSLDDAREAPEYTLPDLVTMVLRDRPDFVSPKYREVRQIEIAYGGETYALESHDPAEVVEGVARHLRRCDPDIILTQYGDAVLMPMLARLAAERRMELPFNRDPDAGYVTTRGSSYFSYGKIVHKDGAFSLAGRWHLDTENSFMMGEASLDGVVEIARLTQLPVQHQSRASIGSALSSMQLSWALRHGYLVPARKREPEGFKSASTLLLADRGGLIFQPVMGYHGEIAELDFVSMYPTIMVEHNVSPETVNCRCCSNRAVPELGYTICERREGIVPATLRTVVRKRAQYKKEKKRLKALGDERWKLYDRRQNALKWMLVTCFGYLGYKNARFGRIEAHESVNAFSREAILRAKEMAEAKGYRFIHAIVDCMWLSRDGATERDYELLAEEVGREAHIDLSLEGIYTWILFPPSKMDPRIPTANRYVGWYRNGEIKIRGVEMRRRDTPVFIKRIQGEMLQVLGAALSVAEVEKLLPAALAKAKEHIDLLRSGKADPLQLVIRRHLMREPDEYTTNTANAVAARALEEAGVSLSPGEMVEYVLVDATGKKQPEKAKAVALYALEDGYDIEKYTAMGLDAVETLTLPLGWDVERLKSYMGIVKERPRRTAHRAVEGQMRLFDTV